MITLGIDGGGTRTRIALEADGEVSYIERPISLKVLHGDYQTSAHELQSLVRELTAGDRIDAMYIGLSGMSQPTDQAILEEALLSLPKFSGTCIKIEGDASLTLKAALRENEDGILLIAGTGSVAFARKNGKVTRAGGWGPILSDEGSGYWIGLRALLHYVRSLDMMDAADALSYAIAAALPEELRDKPSAIARHISENPVFPSQFAKIPFETLQESSRSSEIVHEAALELEKLIKTAARSAQIKSSFLHLHGSIATHPVIVAEIRRVLDGSAFSLKTIDERAPARKALEFAKSLTN
jgi:N-acetylglucosamine kinase-like BadF-type ATPase